MGNTRKTIAEIRNIVSKVLLENPFVEGWKIKVSRTPMFGVFHKADPNKQVTILKEAITYIGLNPSAAVRNALMGMSRGALNLFLWMVYELEPGKDRVWLDRERYKRVAGIGEKSLNNSILELTAAEIILEVTESEVLYNGKISSVYYVNPRLVFRGSRKHTFDDHLEER